MSTRHKPVLWLRPFEEVDRSVPDIGMRVLPGRVAVLSHPVNADPNALHYAEGSSRDEWVCVGCGRTTEILPSYPCPECGGKIELAKTPSGKPRRGYYEPDLATVVSDQVPDLTPGEVVVVAPDHGAFYPFDKRELRLLGVAMPWWESIVGKWSPEGFAPSPGWMLIDREPVEREIEVAKAKRFMDVGKVLGCNGQVDLSGERVEFGDWPCYTFRGLPESWCVVRAPIAGRKWLQGAA